MRAAAVSYAIWGSKGHAKVIEEIIRLHGGRVVALFDNDPSAQASLAGINLHIGRDGFERWKLVTSNLEECHGAVAIGGPSGSARLELLDLFENAGLQITPLIHPNATVSTSAIIEKGGQILANSVVAAGARVGRGTILNHGAIVDHETTVGPGAHVAPRAVLCGCVTVERCAFIGAGAIILPRITIGADSIVGAGAVVTRDVLPGSVVIGNPARPHIPTSPSGVHS